MMRRTELPISVFTSDEPTTENTWIIGSSTLHFKQTRLKELMNDKFVITLEQGFKTQV
jgi:hypothetical protein